MLDTHARVRWLSNPEAAGLRAAIGAASRHYHIIVATALMMGAPLASSNRRILEYPHVDAIWE